MSDTSVAIAQSLVTAQSASTRQALQTEIVRQQTNAEQSIVDLLQQSVAQQKASLPAGQGQAIDITA
jgi:3-dehydroquinate dehydratase